MTDTPLIEPKHEGESGASDGASTTSNTETARTGPSVSFTFADGNTVVLDKDDLLVYLAFVQTLCFLFLVHTEVTDR